MLRRFKGIRCVLALAGLIVFGFSLKAEIKIKKELAELVLAWDKSNNERNHAFITQHYSRQSMFYGKTRNLDEVVAGKKDFWQRNSRYSQQIISAINVTSYPGNLYKCDFNKSVFHKGKTTEYPSYLVIRQEEDGRLRIVEEGDEVTDKNLKRKPEYGPALDAGFVTQQDLESESDNSWVWITAILVLGATGVGYRFRNKRKIASPIIQAPPVAESPIPQEQPNKPEQKGQPVEEVQPINPTRNFRNENEQKGDMFEGYVVSLFEKTNQTYKGKYFQFIAWRGDKGTNGIYPESSKHPDLEYSYTYKDYQTKFAIECKYRSRWNKRSELCSTEQLRNYRKYGFDKGLTVYVVLGLGGTADNPEELFLIPLNDIKTTKPERNWLESYKKHKHTFFFQMKEHVLS